MENSKKRFELISFELCPYVQRSVILLKHKKVDFKITFIDLSEPPEWFDKISPLGKVPVLLVRNGETSDNTDAPVILFESQVINEYMDEITPPSLLPKDPLEKARERAWVAMNDELLRSLYTLSTSPKEFDAQEIWDLLPQLENALPGGKFFSSRGFSLVDAAFAPFFMRLFLIESLKKDAHWERFPKTREWAEALLSLPEVRESVVRDFQQKFNAYLKENGAPSSGEKSGEKPGQAA
jgi:glutathione S-transferase